MTIEPIGHVRSPRADLRDDDWGDTVATIELVPALPAEALDGLDAFSHAEVIFLFDRVDPTTVERGTRHPRGNTAWPRVGIFAQRAKDRPNRLGSTIVEIRRREGRVLTVVGLDAVDGTPVLDVKPVMREFLPRTAVRQPAWSHELMRDYWMAAAPDAAMESPGPDDPTETILALERAALDRWGRGDPSGFVELSAPDVVYFDPSLERRLDGREALARYYERLRGIAIARYEILNPLVQCIGDAAVLTFNFVAWDAADVAHRWSCTEVYRRSGTRWEIVQTHWSSTQPVRA